MQLEGLRVNFLGDSITEGLGISHISKGYVNILKEHYRLKEARNYGWSGTTYAAGGHWYEAAENTPTYNASLGKDYCSRGHIMGDADLILVFGGTNDFGAGCAPIGSFEDRTSDTFYGACHVLYQSLIDRYPHSKIVILTPLHRACEDNPMGEGARPEPTGTLEFYVDIIRRVAKHYGLPILDLFATTRLNPRNAELFARCLPDGLHPNDEGHQILAQEIGTFLEQL